MQRAITIDIGNTWTKTCVFRGRQMLHSVRTRHPEPDVVARMARMWNVGSGAFCSVRGHSPALGSALDAALGGRLLEVNGSIPLPIGIDYADPMALGADRIAAACGAAAVAGNDDPLLVIDAGTAITADIVKDGRFAGGKISPGVRLRLEALHTSTGRLPEVDAEGEVPPLGHDTAGCILAGTLGGIISEVRADIRQARDEFGCRTAILTGGHASFIARGLGETPRIRTIILPELASLGLKIISDYNNEDK